ncbi:hypothetical protein ACFWBI_39620 [Streptomyces sp. NPDC059982]|uniref:hypothetical protein n=1 Tax=unclassified Streptomyces TaxID=2593676 RepID=UPI0036749B62
MDRTLRDLGAAHEGAVGVLLEDGSEPGPVHFDVGSGGHLRGACACGWRGAAEYPLDWTVLDDQRPLYEADVDLAGPIADYQAHLTVVRDAAVPLPESLSALLNALLENLETALLPSSRG